LPESRLEDLRQAHCFPPVVRDGRKRERGRGEQEKEGKCCSAPHMERVYEKTASAHNEQAMKEG
jgi:hypothetical protein